jgi:hypothetical protein
MVDHQLRRQLGVLLSRAPKAKPPAKPKAVDKAKKPAASSGGTPVPKSAKVAGNTTDKLNELYLTCLEPPGKPVYVLDLVRVGPGPPVASHASLYFAVSFCGV